MEVIKTLVVRVQDQSQVGEARRSSAELGRWVHFDETAISNVSIIVTEAASNLLKHAGGGEIVLHAIRNEDQNTIEILAIDKGPGIRNIGQALRDGHSTAGSVGIGLGAISRLSTEFDLHSQAQMGTVIYSRSVMNSRPDTRRRNIQTSGICVAKTGELVSGDGWARAATAEREVILAVDGLGHGPLAAEAAHVALDSFWKARERPPAQILETIHKALKSTRGAAASIVQIDTGQGVIKYAGIGNIAAQICTPSRNQNMVTYNGTLGHQVYKFQEFQYKLEPDAIVVIHSDGLSSHWDFSRYPGIMARQPFTIAGILYRDFRKDHDDTTVIVSKINSM